MRAASLGLAKGQLEAQQEQSSALLVQLQARQQRLTDLQQQIHSKNAAYTQKQTEIQQLTQRMDGGQQETKKLRLHADEVGEQLFAVQADVRAVQAQLESLHQRERHVGDDVRSAQQRTGQEQQAQQSMQDELEHLRRSIKQAELEHKTRHDAAQEAGLALHAARNAHQKLKSELTDSENRVRMLTELQRDYEGFSRAVKLVMNQASSGALKGVRRDKAEAVAVLSGNCQRTVHILRHNGSAEGIVHDVAVIRFTFDQIRRHAAKARLMFQAGFAQRLRTNRVHRQKGRAAAVTALEHLNGFFAIFRALDNDIGSSRTQCRFHRCDIAIRHMNERGQWPA